MPCVGGEGVRATKQWDSSADAGIGYDEHWLAVNNDYKTVNVQFELEDPGSMLNLYRRLLAYRKSSNPLRSGSFLTHPSSNEDVYVFGRSANSETVIVAINLSSEVQLVDIEPGRVVVSTATTSERLAGREGLLLPKQEAVIIEPDV